jgi:hippurate hydrolase
MATSSQKLISEARELLPAAVALRRRIHSNPELGLDLPQTSAAVLEALGDLDLEIERSEKTSGLVATLHGARPGPTILLRADMDALPLSEDSELDFASTIEGRMHACGHDAHTAMLASAARLLDRHRAALAGSVKLLFQPGEEGHFGAKFMLDEGVLDRSGAPDAIFALHISPQLPVGIVATRPGPVFAAADVWSVQLKGRGGHASMPHDTLDPVPVACEIVQALQTLVTRRIDAFDPVVLTVTKIEAGTTTNVIPETANLLGTLRSTSENSRSIAQEGIRRIATGVAEAHQLEASVHVIPGYPVTVNDAGFAGFVQQVTTDLLGDGSFLEMPAPIMGAEDFSFLLQRWPGAMAFLGVRPEDSVQPAPCHSNRMVMNEEGMTPGIALYAAVALRYLGGESAPTAGA